MNAFKRPLPAACVHPPWDTMGVVHPLQTVASSRMELLVRVPWNDAVAIERVPDAGPTTLLAPFAQSADEAARAVAASRYPPEGGPGMSSASRASKFGTVANFRRSANRLLRTQEAVQVHTLARNTQAGAR